MTIDRRAIADPKTRYGHGAKGTRSFIVQRVSGALNIGFLGFFIWFVVTVAGGGREALLATVRHPVVGIALLLLVASVLVHMRIGLREVIEDYVGEPRTNRLALLCNDIFCLGVALLAAGSIVSIMIQG